MASKGDKKVSNEEKRHSRDEKKISQEKRASKNPKLAMEKEALNLIAAITDFDRDEENFDICERFVLSNLFYHRYLDPEESKVMECLSGIQQKFRIHAQPEKAQQLENLVHTYNAGSVWKEQHEQFDIRYRLLSFLLHLSESPVNFDYSPPLTDKDSENDSEVDWLAVLREGEPSPLSWQHDGDDTLSEWSDDEEVSDVSVHEQKVTNGDCESSMLYFDAVKDEDLFQKKLEESGVWVKETLQPLYWQKSQDVVESSLPDARLATRIENEQEKLGMLNVKSKHISEYQAVREVLWMLRCPTETPLFQLKNGTFEVVHRTTIPSLTDAAFRNLLHEAIPAINAVYNLNQFLEVIDDKSHWHPRTFEAYGEGLRNFLQTFSQFLSTIETDVKRQEDTFTLTELLNKLQSWFDNIVYINRLHNLATKEFSLITENWYKSIRLLSVLYNSLSTTIKTNCLPYVVDIFLQSVKPYLVIMQTWLAEGRLEDWRKEFIFYKREDEAEDGEDFWIRVFRCHDYKARLLQERITPLRLLNGLDSKILVSGKSIEILRKLDEMYNDSYHQSASNEKEIFDTFIESIEAQLNRTETHENQDKEVLSPNLDAELEELVGSSECPYLALAMKEVFLALPETEKNIDETGNNMIINTKLDPLFPMELLFQRALTPIIETHYNSSSKNVVNLFMNKLELEKVLSRVRIVYFLEAGDLMSDFCVQVFEMLQAQEEVETDSATLTLLLKDCLGHRFPSWADQFSVDYSPEVKSGSCGLNIHFNAPWPLTMVLSQANIAIYNRIFDFLVEVKRSLWALQSLKLNRLQQIEEELDLETSSLSISMQVNLDESMTVGCKQHRLLLLRAWLLSFTTTIHDYFMTRVVYSTELELRKKLATATDLDVIIKVHQEYLKRIHDRCFLHSSACMIREAISMILKICVDVHVAVMYSKPINTETLLAWEEKYARCHRYLASTLQIVLANKKMPHLEGLLVALLHSCPT